MTVTSLLKGLICALAVGILGIAMWLAPDPDGRGTVPQLFPPCAIGTDGPIRCPTCGLTSGMAALVRGRPILALRRNLWAPVVFLLCLVALYLAGGSLWMRRPVLELPGAIWLHLHARWLPVVLVLLYAVMHFAR